VLVMMKIIVERVLFSVACLGSAMSLLWQILALAGNMLWPQNPLVLAICAAVLGCLLTLTFRRYPTGDPWHPVLRVTRQSIAVARLCLKAALIINVLSIIFASISGLGGWPSFELALFLVVSSIILLGFLYMTLHWGFRPSNLFSERFRGLVTEFPFIWRR
jgi:hypothetical protein